ncbi:MAG TPA: periplasmic heavy metal sensor [Pyrinomonadaceae bacterium]|nr:periplasmic heavy metal sensor [Pyrinomonadaceae bacterium]
MKKKIATLTLVLLVGALVGVVIVSAQQPQPAQGPEQPRPPHPPMDPLGDAMFPPELIMQHTRDLNLTDEQKTFMRAEINRTTTRFNELQWQLQDAMEALHTAMKENTVNEQQALAQLDKVLDTEREIKRLHFGLAIAIKNKLTVEQQTKLHAMMQMHMQMQMHGPDGGPGRGPGGPGGPGPGGPGPGGPPPGQRPEGNLEPMN